MNDKKISFSILMANYNNSKYIETAIKSVINQTYPHWELVIVDDKSSDDSIGIVKKYLMRGNIKLIQHNKNLGYGGSLKTAANNALNEILCILDPDDKLHETALEVLAEAYQKHPEYGFIYSTMWICDSNLENCKISTTIGPITPDKKTIFNHEISHLKSFKKEVYNKTIGFEISQKRTVDKDIIYKLEEVTEFNFINKPLYYYRKHQAGISQYKNIPEAFLFHYIAKLKAYNRRVNTNLPNFSKRELYRDYSVITFKSINNWRKKVFKVFRIYEIMNFIQRKCPIMMVKLKRESKEPFKSLLLSIIDVS